MARAGGSCECLLQVDIELTAHAQLGDIVPPICQHLMFPLVLLEDADLVAELSPQRSGAEVADPGSDAPTQKSLPGLVGSGCSHDMGTRGVVGTGCSAAAWFCSCCIAW